MIESLKKFYVCPVGGGGGGGGGGPHGYKHIIESKIDTYLTSFQEKYIAG